MRRAPLTAALVVAALAACYHSSGYTTAPPNPILPPSNLTYELVPSGDPTTPVGILLRWDPSTDTRVNVYNVYSRPAANAAWGLRATTTSASFYDLGIPDLQYQVTAMDVNGIESAASNAITVSSSDTLSAPTGLTSISLNMAVQLSWSPNARNAAPALFQYYRVYSTDYSLTQNLCSANWVLEGTTVSEDFIASGLPNGAPRCFAVSAVTIDGHESTWSGARSDTPRFDARNILITAFQQTPATSGFLFFDAATNQLGEVVAGSRTDIDFRVDRHSDGSLWLLPIRAGTGVADLGQVADLTSIDFAPATGYGTVAVPAVVSEGYVFQMSQSDGAHYGGMRVTALGTGYAIVDWSYQSDPQNPELRRVH